MSAGASPLAGRRILVVEDRYLIAAEVCEQVKGLGCIAIGPLATLERALRAAAEEQMDGALLDVNLDQEPVYPLAKALRDRGVPLIFLTGYDAEILPPEWRDAPRLQKPVSARSLHDALVKALG